VIAALVPTLVLAACGFARNGTMLVAAAVLVGVWLVVDVAVARNSAYQRTDVRGAVRALPPSSHDQVWVLATAARTVRLYLPGSRPLREDARVDEVVYMRCSAESGARFSPPAGFRLASSRHVQQCDLSMFRGSRPTLLGASTLIPRVTTRGRVNLLFEPGRDP
jgi:hypothetical protein